MSARAWILAAAVALVGCAPTYFPAAVPSAPSFATDLEPIEIGAARADITLPPGVATFGHGPDARVTNGVWTRLYCRAFVFKQAERAALAIVPCDLPAISMLLQRRVAEEVARAGIALPAPRLMLTATHTHAGPAHYFDGAAFSGLGSSQLPGYDDAVTTRLATQIASAVVHAYGEAKTARIRWSRRSVYGLTRNRDIAAFIRNASPPWALNCPDRSELCAIDPELSVLEMNTTGPGGAVCPIGSLTFFAMHPTVLPNTNQLFGADAFGVASRALEERLAGQARLGNCPPDPLAGIVNTNEGDISARFSSGTVEEAVAIGSALAGEAAAAIASSNEADMKFDPIPALAARYVEADLRSSTFGLKGAPPTCDQPEQGIVGALGAADHPTFLNALRGDLDPRDPLRNDCQAPKRAFFPVVAQEAKGPRALPTVVPFAVVRIGDEVVTFIPAELTLAAGARVKDTVRRSLEADHPSLHYVIAGLSNGYILYATTPEEYDVQGYEGTCTLFGPQTAPLIARIAGALARRLYDSTATLPNHVDEAYGHQYFVGPERHRLPQGTGDPTLQDLGSQRAPVTLCSMAGARPAAVCFIWADGAPGVVPSMNGPWIGLVKSSQPRGTSANASSEALLIGDHRVDDRGVEFRTRVQRPSGDAWLWSTVFRPTHLTSPPPPDWADFDGAGPVSIRVDLGTSYELESDEFTSTVLPPPCSVGFERLCGE